MDKTSLGDRMKTYEKAPAVNLMRKTPVIMRLDGKAFHTYTRHPLFTQEGTFSPTLRQCFAYATQKLMNQIQGSRLAYMQSDEVSILITDWRKVTSDAWFNYGTQKMVSVAVSMFTVYFNDYMRTLLEQYAQYAYPQDAFFDARVFNLPPHEVINYFIWRQQDAIRNSIQMLGRSKFSHKQMDGKNTDQVQDMLMAVHNVNWNDTPTAFKRGHCIRTIFDNEDRVDLIDDLQIPIFTENRDYIDRYVKEII